MLDYNFTLMTLRFHKEKDNTLVFCGWYRENNPDHRTLKVYLDKEELCLRERVFITSQRRARSFSRSSPFA